MKNGTKIEVETGGFGHPISFIEATIVKHRKDKPYPATGYHRVKFADGGMMAVHENNFRVVSKFEQAAWAAKKFQLGKTSETQLSAEMKEIFA